MATLSSLGSRVAHLIISHCRYDTDRGRVLASQAALRSIAADLDDLVDVCILRRKQFFFRAPFLAHQLDGDNFHIDAVMALINARIRRGM